MLQVDSRQGRGALSKHVFHCLVATLAAAAIPAPAATIDMRRPTAPVLAPHRDGNIAIAQELDAARHAGTIGAYDLFLARHPTHALARTARRERARLLRGRARRD